MLVPGLVIFFPMVRGGRTVRVCGEFVELSSSLVRVIWHSVSNSRGTTPSWNHSIFQSVH